MASAAVINIPAITFVPRNISQFVETDEGYVNAGVLDGAFGRFFAPVEFPAGGEVCSFSVIYRDDNNLGYAAAKLFKKKFSIGQSPYTEPVLMAAVQSTGADTATRRLVEPDITAPKIEPANAFYYVELTLGLGVQAIGIQVNYRPDKCPP